MHATTVARCARVQASRLRFPVSTFQICRYSFVAVNVPTIERNLNGLSSSSTLVTNTSIPEIVFAELNRPLNIIVPTSRQHVPIGNSVSPEKLTRSFVSWDQTPGA